MLSPRLIQADADSIVIEYIPHSVTLEELTHSSQVFSQIAAIHQLQLVRTGRLNSIAGVIMLCVQRFNSYLSALKNRTCLKSCSPKVISFLITQRSCLVTPTMVTGRREMGNWYCLTERFSKGSPAINLVPLIKGLGDEEAMLRIVDSYMNVHKAMPREELFRHVIIAKAWIVVEVTNLLYERQKPQLQKYLDWFNANLPRWIRGVEALV